MTSRNSFRRAFLTASVSALTAVSAVAIPSGLWNTGVNSSGVAMGVGSAEIHYTVTASFAFGPIEVVSRPSVWVNPSPAPAAWIGPDIAQGNQSALGSDPVGVYKYSLTFNNYSSLPSITGFWATDNTSRILLNNVYTGFSKTNANNAFSSLQAFTLTSGFNTGLNTLTFEVTNATGPTPSGNPSGLLVTGLTGNVPDGGVTVLLIGLGLAGLASVRRLQVRR